MMKDIPDILIDENDLIFNFSDQLGIYATKAQVHAGEKDTVTLKCRICNTLEHQVRSSLYIKREYCSSKYLSCYSFVNFFLFFQVQVKHKLEKECGRCLIKWQI